MTDLLFPKDHYDAVVIGTGAGGGTAGYKLAVQGKRVLFVERGPLFDDAAAFQDERAMQIEKRACDRRLFTFGTLRERAFIGGVAGGSTALYGACLMRPARIDFTPGKYYSQHLDRSFWEWPISYEELAPFYTEAEDLYRVAGVTDQSMPRLKHRPTAYPAEPLPLTPTNVALRAGVEKLGLRPFVLPMGIDAGKCDRCPSCPGYICPTGARASSLNRCIAPATGKYRADLMTQTEVVRVLTRGRCIRGLALQNHTGRHRVATDLVILAAGAIGSPVFLMQHGLTGGNDTIGRNYMFHLGVLFTALCARPTGAGRTFMKQLGFTDLYLSPGKKAHKLGYIQQLPIPGILTMQDQIPLPLPRRLLEEAFARNITFAGAIEDLPQPTNQVRVRGREILIQHS